MKNGGYGKAWLTLVALTFFLAFAFQGSRGLWEPDEGRYVRCAYEMQKTGDWVTPQINFKPHFTKPPVTYWLIASGLSLFGKNEWGGTFLSRPGLRAHRLDGGLYGQADVGPSDRTLGLLSVCDDHLAVCRRQCRHDGHLPCFF